MYVGVNRYLDKNFNTKCDNDDYDKIQYLICANDGILPDGRKNKSSNSKEVHEYDEIQYPICANAGIFPDGSKNKSSNSKEEQTDDIVNSKTSKFTSPKTIDNFCNVGNGVFDKERGHYGPTNVEVSIHGNSTHI